MVHINETTHRLGAYLHFAFSACGWNLIYVAFFLNNSRLRRRVVVQKNLRGSELIAELNVSVLFIIPSSFFPLFFCSWYVSQICYPAHPLSTLSDIQLSWGVQSWGNTTSFVTRHFFILITAHNGIIQQSALVSTMMLCVVSGSYPYMCVLGMRLFGRMFLRLLL
jgi:hypothetical protein